ncbi:GNAT family N-acetyltransferase [Streptomyces chumphonensis]|uniref:GNAT family N-acetyltransferase n=1 Tax=Streptomyces chumphonensis TaxID=1214925 RepID=UPI003D709C77
MQVPRSQHITHVTAPGAELDRIYQEILKPSFTADELGDPAQLERLVNAGSATVFASHAPDGRPLGTAIGEWDAKRRIVLLSWLAVRPGLRGAGTGGALLQEALRHWITWYDPCLVLAEVSDPLGRSANPAAGSTVDHGDAAARLRFYLRLGGRVLDLPYFQPALGPGLARVEDELLLVLHAHAEFAGAAPETIDAAVLRGYIEDYLRECEGSVGDDSATARLLEALDRPCGIPWATGSDVGDHSFGAPGGRS